MEVCSVAQRAVASSFASSCSILGSSTSSSPLSQTPSPPLGRTHDRAHSVLRRESSSPLLDCPFFTLPIASNHSSTNNGDARKISAYYAMHCRASSMTSVPRGYHKTRETEFAFHVPSQYVFTERRQFLAPEEVIWRIFTDQLPCNEEDVLIFPDASHACSCS